MIRSGFDFDHIVDQRPGHKPCCPRPCRADPSASVGPGQMVSAGEARARVRDSVSCFCPFRFGGCLTGGPPRSDLGSIGDQLDRRSFTVIDITLALVTLKISLIRIQIRNRASRPDTRLNKSVFQSTFMESTRSLAVEHEILHPLWKVHILHHANEGPMSATLGARKYRGISLTNW